MRSIKYTAKYGIGFNVPNPIVRDKKEESVDVLMKRLYMMPLPKGNGDLVHHGVGHFGEDEDEGEEADDEEGLNDTSASSMRSETAQISASSLGVGKAFESGMRTFSKGLSSVSDSSTSSATSPSGMGSPIGIKTPLGASKATTAPTNNDEEEGGGEEEEDDGFGAMNISAHRIPTEDTALTRFIRRAIANNGEAAQISHLKNMEWVCMPRSEEEILATLDKRFYEPDFDPALHMLESFPAHVEDFNAYVEKQLSEKDIAKEHIMAELATRVEANYHVLIEGMKNVQEVDLDLTATGIQTVECRRRLSVADRGVRDPFMHILRKRVRRETLQKVANVAKGAHGVLRLEREAKAAAAAGKYERAVAAATEAKLALDSDVLKNVNMMDGVDSSLDKLLPDLRLAVDKCLRRMCAGKGGGGSSAAVLSTEYAWILRAYLTLDDHGIRLSSKPRSSVNANPLYVEGAEPEDSLAVGIVPIAPTVDRGGIPGLSERIQRFTAMELDYCIKVAIIAALLTAKPPAPSPTTTTAALASTATTVAASTASLAAKALRSTGVSPTHATSSGPSRGLTSGASQAPPQLQSPAPAPVPVVVAPPDVVRDVHGRVIAYKGRRLSAWAVQDLIRQLPAGTAVGVLGKVAEQVSEILHRYFLIVQWHRSPFDEKNKEEAFLHRAPEFSRQKSDVAGGLSDDEDEEGDDDEEEDGSVSKVGGKKKAAAKRSSPKVGNEDEDEEEEEEEEGFYSPSSRPQQDDSKLDAAEKAWVLKERKKDLETARLAAVARGIKQARKQLWAPIERAVVALLGEEDLGVEALVQVLATGELLVALGEEFGRNESSALKALIHVKCESLLEKTHKECFGVMRQMLDRETWYNVPISVEDLGGMTGVVNNHIRPLSWPHMNGWGRVVKERVTLAALAKGAAEAGSSPRAALASILCKFVAVGNPFLGSGKPPAVPDAALVIFDPAATATTASLIPIASPAVRSPGGTTALPAIPKQPPLWSITQAALNGFAKYAGRYLQLMHLYPSMALSTYTALLQLLDFYVYMVFAIFAPEQSVQLFLTHMAQVNRETSVVEEMSWASHEVHVPLPCEEGQELVQLKAYLNRVREDLIEVEHWGLTMGVEAANKMKKLGADAAKKLGALAASSATSSLMSGVGGGRSTPSPPPAPHHAGMVAPPPPIHVQAPPPAHGGESDSEDEEEDGTGRRTPSHAGTKRLIKKVRFQRPAFIAEALEDADSLYGLSQRAVAVESCFFILEILKSLQPQVLAVLPKSATLSDNRGTCETYMEQVTQSLTQLRVFVYRCAAPRLVGAARLIEAIEAQQWNQNRIREEANFYTEEVCATCQDLWAKIKGPDGQAAGPPGMGAMGGLDNMYIPPQVQLPIWNEVVQAVMAALLEGFARVERCSTEGRSLMSMDLQAVQSGLDEVQKVRPTRGKAYVDDYIKAFYYGEEDVMAWIQQHYQSYFFRHLAGLLNAGVGQKKKRGLREMIVKVAALYAPEGEEDEAEEAEEHSGVFGGGGGSTPTSRNSGSGSSGGGIFGSTNFTSGATTHKGPSSSSSKGPSSSASPSHGHTSAASITSAFSDIMKGKGLF